MKQTYSKRLDALEAQACPPFSIPDDLSTLSDAELDALIAWSDRLNGPTVTKLIESMSDAELDALAQMDDASAAAYIRERMR